MKRIAIMLIAPALVWVMACSGSQDASEKDAAEKPAVKEVKTDKSDPAAKTDSASDKAPAATDEAAKEDEGNPEEVKTDKEEDKLEKKDAEDTPMWTLKKDGKKSWKLEGEGKKGKLTKKKKMIYTFKFDGQKFSIKGKKMVWDQGGMIQELRRQ